MSVLTVHQYIAIVNRPIGGSVLHYSLSEDFKKDVLKVDGYNGVSMDPQKKENVAVVCATECTSRSMTVPSHGASASPKQRIF